MKVLLLTNHLAMYGGSEIQIFELYQYFKNQNHTAQVYANYFDQPMMSLFSTNDIIYDIEQINLNEFDVVWSQHCIFSRLFKSKIYQNLQLKLFSVHLSPFEIFEYGSLPYMKYINAYFIANSFETRDKLIDFGIENQHIYTSHNFCPKSYLPIPPSHLSHAL